MRYPPTLSRVSPSLLLAAAVLSWALNWIAGRALRYDVPSFSLAFWRWVIASVLLLPFAWPHLVRGWPAMRRSWQIMLVLGVLGTTFCNLASYTGLKYTTAVSGSILSSFAPVIIIAISWALLGKRLRPLQWTGVAISLIGVLSIIGRGDPSGADAAYAHYQIVSTRDPRLAAPATADTALLRMTRFLAR